MRFARTCFNTAPLSRVTLYLVKIALAAIFKMKSSNTSTIGVSPEEQLPLVHNILRKLAWQTSTTHGIEFHECMSEAYKLFMDACQKYDPSRGAKFSTFLTYRVGLNLKTMVARQHKYEQRFPHFEDWRHCSRQLSSSRKKEEEQAWWCPSVETDPAFFANLSDHLVGNPANEPVSDLWAELSEDAREIVQLILETPSDILGMVSKRMVSKRFSRRPPIEPRELLERVVKHVKRSRGAEAVETALVELKAHFGPIQTVSFT